MVGVAGRSKGCATCRRRKIKCDLKRPGCTRCEKSGINCEGYEKYAVFIRKGIDGWEKRKPLEETKPRHDFSDPNIPIQLKSIAVEGAQFIDHFFRDFVCAPETGAPKQDYVDPVAWARGMEFLQSSESLLHNVLIAVSMVYCGKCRRNRDLLRQGRAWYSRSLYQLCKLLGSDQSSYDDQVLVSTSVCMAYETIDPSDPGSATGWTKHLGGITNLLQHRGPSSFDNARSRDVLEDSRYMLMMSGLVHRKSSFLIQEQWMTEPWESVDKSLQQQVVDCGLLLGAIFEHIDMLQTQAEATSSSVAETVLNECLNLERTLQRLAAEPPGTPQLEEATGAWSTRAQRCSGGTSKLANRLRLQISIIGIRLRIHEAISTLAQQYNLPNFILEGLPDDQSHKAVASSALDLVAAYMAINVASVAKGRHVFALERAKAQFDTNEAEFERCSRLLYEIQDEQCSSDLLDGLANHDGLETWCVMVTNPRKSIQRRP